MIAVLTGILMALQALPAVTAFEDAPKTEVMVLGTFHFHQTDTPDVMEAEHQSALKGIVERLSRFKPTVIGLECVAEEEDGLNETYRAWRLGEAELSRNERQQLGFRLAAANGLQGITCLDAPFPPAPNFDQFAGWDEFLAHAEERGDDALYEKWLAPLGEYVAQRDAFMAGASLPEIMDFMNGPDAQFSQGRMLSIEMDVGIGDSWAGPDFFGRFEGRNARIFASTKVSSDENDRVLIIVGNAHKLPLERMFRDSWEFEIKEVPALAD